MYKGWSRRNEVSTDLAPDRDLDEVGHDIAPLFRPASLLTRPVDPTIEFMKTTAIGVRKNAGFREFLQRKLAQSCANNPQYSLRAFAKSLGTDHSTLSQILRGKRRLTAETIRALARQLKLWTATRKRSSPASCGFTAMVDGNATFGNCEMKRWK